MDIVDPRPDPRLLPARCRAVVIAEQQQEFQDLPSVRTPRGQVITRKRVREFLGPLLEDRTFLSTTSLYGANHDFLMRLGFWPTWTDSERQHYMMTDVPTWAPGSAKKTNSYETH